MPTIVLAGVGSLAAAAWMALAWLWQRRLKNLAIFEPARTALIGALAVVYAALASQGALGRRVAIASMIGSWGLQIAVYRLYGGVAGREEPARFAAERARHAGREDAWSLGRAAIHAAAAVLLSAVALPAVIDPAQAFTPIEYTAAALWFVGFAGEATVERRRLGPPSAPDSAYTGDAERSRGPLGDGKGSFETGITRVPTWMFEALIWTAFVLFALASPRGWLAIVAAAAGWAILQRV